jgi:tetratricopeptide (TPR) repeat protein
LLGPLPLLLEGELELIEGRRDRARELLSQAIDESTSSWALIYRAEAHYYLSKLARSTGDLRAAAEHARIALDNYRTLAPTDLSFEAPLRVAQAEQLQQGDTQR